MITMGELISIFIQDKGIYTLIDLTNANVTYIGQSSQINKDDRTFEPDTSNPIFSICRILINGTNVTFQMAGKGKFDAVWDDRAELFPEIPA